MAKKKHKKKSGTFFKVIIGGIVAHGMACVSITYYLAWSDHSQIAESLSGTIISEIIAPIIVYGATKTIENIFEKNKLSFSEPIKEDTSNE